MTKTMPRRRHHRRTRPSPDLDPEVFTHLRRARPRQVERIVIRDVVGARVAAPERLSEVDEIIDAPLVSHGRSQFN
ncbi:MAG: hypothetical protein LC800_03225 [Acidobacteria bacterium]|nr:hypothetical protein [Acidobacteriota bacterium]